MLNMNLKQILLLETCELLHLLLACQVLLIHLYFSYFNVIH